MTNNEFIRLRFLYSFLLLAMHASIAFAQSCYTPYKSQTGITALHDQILDSMACEVISAIDSVNFKVIGLDLYPVYAYVNPADGYDKTLNQLTSEIDSAYTSYIAISKEMFENAEVRYGIHIKWGTATAFESLSDIDKTTIKNVLTTKAASEYERLGSSVSLNAAVELAILKEFMRYVNEGVDVDYFDGAGFDKTTLSETQVIERTDEYVDYPSGIFNIINTMNFTADGIPLHEHIGATPVKSYMSHLNTTIYITSDDYISDPGNLNQIATNFENDQSKIKIWFHFNFLVPDGSTAQGSSSRMSSDRELLVKSDNNLDDDETEQMLDDMFNDFKNQWTGDTTMAASQDCSFNPQWGKKCLFFKGVDFFSFIGSASAYFEANTAFICGFIDGFIGMCNFVYSGFNKISEWSFFDWIVDVGKWIISTFSYENMKNFFTNLGPNVEAFIDDVIDSTKKLWNFIQNGFDYIQQLLKGFWSKLTSIVGTDFVFAVVNSAAYFIGVLAFDGLVDILTLGVSRALKGAKLFDKISSIFKSAPDGKGAAVKIQKEIDTPNASSSPSMTKCGIHRQGCFVKNTPVLMARNNSFGNTAKAMAVAASMPIVAVPIQDVQLLDYAVAHENVNATYGLTAKADDGIYLGLIDKDPYTSDQQRERDKYQLDDENWNEVVFEEVQGRSTAKLALHNDWINQKGYQVDALVEMNLPEQGITGPFRITSIKHIIPQKKPVDDDEADEYGYKPITGLFIHEASDVWKLTFDNGEELGVTHKHPIYSTTESDWKHAGELEIGEVVLNKSGGTKVVAKEIDKVQEVYNLEVKDYHNFLVNASGVVVHNSGLCHIEVNKLLKPFKGVQIKKVGVKNGAVKNGNRVDLPDGRSVPINGKEIPDFTDFTAKTSNGTHLQTKIEGLKGNGGPNLTKQAARKLDNDKANQWLIDSGLLDDVDSHYITPGGSPVRINGKNYTWHHHENGKTMMLVEQSVHNSVTHTGGAALISSGAVTGLDNYATIFPDPIFD